MRVLIVASIDPARHTGGAERVAALLGREMAEDHDVTMLSLENPDGGQDGSVPWNHVQLPLEVPYHPGFPEGRSPVEQAVWHAKELHNGTATAQFSRVIEEEDPFDAVSIHNIQGLSFGVFDVLEDHGLPTAYTIHDFKLASPVLNRQPQGAKRLLSPLWPLYRAWVRRRTEPVDRFIAPSRYLGRELEGDVVDPEELSIVPNGVPIDVAHTLEDPSPKLTMYGVLSPHKGILEFARAFRDSEADLQLSIAGTGSLADQVQALADSDPRISYLGYLEDEDLQAEVADSLAVVVPSLWSENCPMVVLESFAAGTPVLHTDRGGLGELCPPGDLGLGLPESPSKWSEFVEDLDPDELTAMRKRCREVAEQRYSVEDMVDAYERTFEELRGGA